MDVKSLYFLMGLFVPTRSIFTVHGLEHKALTFYLMFQWGTGDSGFKRTFRKMNPSVTFQHKSNDYRSHSLRRLDHSTGQEGHWCV